MPDSVAAVAHTNRSPSKLPGQIPTFTVESTLHRQLKSLYALASARTEVKVGRFRIDVIDDGRLIEIQHASLGSIRNKIRELLRDHCVTVVKPIVEKRYLVRLGARRGVEVNRRLSPKRGKLLDIFDELVHFSGVFPHPNLTIELPLVHIEEYRYPGHGRRRRWRRNDFVVQDRVLLEITTQVSLRGAAELISLVNPASKSLPSPFTTKDLALTLNLDRSAAQRVAYCLKQALAAQRVDKKGNAWLYEFNFPAGYDRKCG